MKTSPLLNSEFLYNLDNHRNRVTYARITSLTNDQYPIDRIEGVVTGGSITIDGDSAVRRVCNLTLTTGKFNINNVYWGLTTRVKIEIGLENNVDPDYDDIIWFPQGVYVLTDFRTSAQVNNYTITLSGKDKMCLLNGDIGGNFNAETQFDTERVQQEDGTWVDEKRSIAYIIKEMVHHYAQENFYNIIIKDIDTLSLKVLYNKKSTFYLIKDKDTEEIVDMYYDDTMVSGESPYYYQEYPDLSVNFKALLSSFVFDLNVDEDDSALLPYHIVYKTPSIIFDKETNKKYTVVKIEPGEDIGYELTETYYPDELIAGVGDTVVSILDKIVEVFGDFEYFYNLDGQFVFQAKETYVNTTWNNLITIDNETYVEPAMVSSKVKYMFESGVLTTAYQNAPKLGSIKNDYTVWGKKKTSSGMEIPIHMRYAIDKKPEYYHTYGTEDNENGIIYISEEFYNKYIVPTYGSIAENNQVNIENQIYSIVDWREIIYQMAKDYYRYNHDDDFEVLIFQHNIDPLFNLQYYEKGKTGYEQYYHDIEGFWRLIYAPKDWLDNYNSDTAKLATQIVNAEDFYVDDKYVGPWNRNIVEDPSALIFWMDFFEAEKLGLGQFSVPAIGNRPKNESVDSIRALIYQDIPDIVFVDKDTLKDYYDNNRLLDGYVYITNKKPDGCVQENIKELSTQYDFIAEAMENDEIYLSSRSLTAQEKIDNLLYNYGYCNETITITSVPIYYLEPNTIISARDEGRMINGYYIINKITLPLDYKGTMQITAIKVPERIY